MLKLSRWKRLVSRNRFLEDRRDESRSRRSIRRLCWDRASRQAENTQFPGAKGVDRLVSRAAIGPRLKIPSARRSRRPRRRTARGTRSNAWQYFTNTCFRRRRADISLEDRPGRLRETNRPRNETAVVDLIYAAASSCVHYLCVDGSRIIVPQRKNAPCTGFKRAAASAAIHSAVRCCAVSRRRCCFVELSTVRRLYITSFEEYSFYRLEISGSKRSSRIICIR